MSKGNGRHFNGKGNGLDKFNGSCNGVFKNKNSSSDDFLSYSNQGKPNSLDCKAGSENYSHVPSDKGIKEFKSKL